MKNSILVLVVLFFASIVFTNCSNPEKEKITVCECISLYDDYQEKKSKAETEEERTKLSTEELGKNVECLKLETSLGDKLEEEQAKCK